MERPTVDQKLFYLLTEIQTGKRKGYEVAKELQELFTVTWKEPDNVA